MAPDPLLMAILRYKRPAWGPTEAIFIERFLDPLPGREYDEFGNIWVRVGDDPKILWSSHTDTVHRTEGLQVLKVNGPFITARCKLRRKKNNCLGADDGTGIWIMLNMIKAGIPGQYIFHRDEEAGGHGSAFVAEYKADKLKGLDYAIAFDRKGYASVITHQRGDRCCSAAFATDVVELMGDLNYSPDRTGVFTDTANYTDLIGECTNLSVGYFDQHGPKESQNWIFAKTLMSQIISADWASLAAPVRKPGEVEPKPAPYKYTGQSNGWPRPGATYTPIQGGYVPSTGNDDPWADFYGSSPDPHEIVTLDDFVYTHTVAVVKFLEDNGFTLEDLVEHRRRRLDGFLP